MTLPRGRLRSGFFRYTNGYDTCTVEYETWFGDQATNLFKLLHFLELEWSPSEPYLNLVT